MKAEQKFKLVKWNKQLISVATGMLLVGQIGLGTLPAFAETTESAADQTQVLENPLMENQDILDDAAATSERTVSDSPAVTSAPQTNSANQVEAVNQQGDVSFEWDISGDVARITGIGGDQVLTRKNLFIPALYNGMPVQINFAEVFGDHLNAESKLYQLAKFEIEDSDGGTPVKIMDENLRGLFGRYDGSSPRSSDNIRSVKFGNADIEKVTSMEGLFIDCITLETIDLTGVDTKNVTNMSIMFAGASRLETLDLSNFNTANVTNMSSMFYNASRLETLDLSDFDTANVTNMSNMFYNAISLKNLELTGKFNTAKVTNMNGMFAGAISLEKLDLSKFNTANVTNMSNMFYNASSLEKLDLSNFNTANVTNMTGMFSNASSLKNLELTGKFNTANVTNMDYMFYFATSLATLDLSNFNTAKVTDMSSMFSYANALTKLKLSNKFKFLDSHYLRDVAPQSWISDTEKFDNVSALTAAQNALQKDTDLPPVTYRVVETPVTIKFEPKDYQINGATFESTQRVTGKGESVADPNVTSDDGDYIITDWKDEGNQSVIFGTTTFNTDTTLTPTNHRKRNYTVIRYSDNEKTDPLKESKDFDDELILDAHFEKAGYTLTGWQDAEGKFYQVNSTFSSEGIPDGATIELFAQWQRNSVTLTANDLTVSLPANSTYDGQSRAASVEVKDPTLQGNFSSYSKIVYLDKDNQKVAAPKNAGTYKVRVDITSGGLLNATQIDVGTIFINKKAATGTINDVTIAQGDALPKTTITYAGFVAGETLDGIFVEEPVAKYAVTDSQTPGVTDIVIDDEGVQKAENYAIEFVPGKLTITEKTVTPEPEEDRLPLYRVYNPNNGEHLYTLDQAEAQGLINRGWLDEGIGWYGGKTIGKAVYRLYNQNSGEHFYTLDAGEYDNVASAGWTKEGVAFYAAEDTEIPIYRVFNPNSQDAGSHHYTLSSSENSWLISEGWKAEGTAFYGK